MGQKREKRCDCGNVFEKPGMLKPRKPLNRVSKKKQAQGKRGGLKRTSHKETPLERKARDHFNEVVKSWPCFFRARRACEKCGGDGMYDFGPIPACCGRPVAGDCCGNPEPSPDYGRCPACGGDGKHHCRGPKDAHHLVPKDFLRQRLASLMPEEEFVQILFNPLIGAPLCRYKAHEAVENGSDRIYWEDLTPECIEYVSGLPDFVLLRLELECPKREPVTEVAA